MIAVVFSVAEVNAALTAPLLEIRRPVKDMPLVGDNGGALREVVPSLLATRGDLFDVRFDLDNPRAIRCPLGAPGDLLWIRERCILPVFDDDPDQVVYAADHLDPEVARAEIQDGADGDVRWRPAICMPRWASRLAYTNRNVRVERVDGAWTWIVTAERVNRHDGTPMPPREIGGGL